MNDRIHVEESALNELRNALQTAGEEYKEQLVKLTNLIEEIHYMEDVVIVESASI